MEGEDGDGMNQTGGMGGAGRTGFGNTNTSYHSHSGGGYATSKTGMTDRRKMEIQALIARGKQSVEQEKDINKRRTTHEFKQRALKEGKVNSRRLDEEHQLEEDAMMSYKERLSKLQRIGKFKFDIDAELDVEILSSDQVFEDLDDIKNIREKTGDPDGNNSAYKSLIMAM